MKKKTKPKAKRKAKGMTVRRVPDTDKLAQLRREIAPLPPQPKPLPAIAAGELSAEQQAVREAGAAATDLMGDNDVFAAVHTMVCMRRGYIIAYREYQEVMERKRRLAEEKGESLPTQVDDFLVQYAMWEASKPFTEHQFMDLLLKTVMPWLADVIDRHTNNDQKEEAEAREQAAEERRSRPINIGLRHTPTQEEPLLERARALVLVGWEKAVLWLLDNACRAALEDGGVSQVVRFMVAAPRVEDQHARLVRVGGSAWAGCCDSEKKLAMCMGEQVADKMSAQPDLVVCDHLPAAHTAGLIGRPEAASAGDAHRRLRKWCDKAGAALLAGVCLPNQEVPDLSEPAYEQLRTFADLRAVRVEEEGPEGYRITIGHAAEVFLTEKSEVDAYGRSALVLPHGDGRVIVEGRE